MYIYTYTHICMYKSSISVLWSYRIHSHIHLYICISFSCLMYEVTEKVGFFCQGAGRKPHTCCIPKQHKRHLVPSYQKHSALQRIGEKKKRDTAVCTHVRREIHPSHARATRSTGDAQLLQWISENFKEEMCECGWRPARHLEAEEENRELFNQWIIRLRKARAPFL